MLNQTLSYIEKILTVSALLATSTSLPEYGHLTSLRSGSKYIAASIWEKWVVGNGVGGWQGHQKNSHIPT